MLLLESPVASARADLRRQVAMLEARLVQLVPVRGTGPARGPRLLCFDELVGVRDELLARIAVAEARERERATAEHAARELLEAMCADPASYRRTRVTLASLGLPGCGEYRVRPRYGVIGRFAGWWQLVLSSGCPLR